MRRKKSILVSFLLIFALLLTACAGDKEDQAPTDASINEEESSMSQEEVNEENEDQEKEEVPIKLVGLKGPTSMGMVKLIDDAQEDPDNSLPVDFEMLTSPDQLAPKLLKGEADVAALPSNLAALLYQKSEGNIVCINLNTLGVLYMVDRDNSVHSIEDLRGKTIYASGKGVSPEYVLRYLLGENGLTEEDVDLEWKNEHAEALAALSQDSSAVALLPQPFVTIAQSKVEDLRIALDLTEEWKKTQKDAENPSALVMGVLVCQKDFLEEHPEEIKALLESYAKSVDFVNDNPEEAAQLIEKYGIFKAPVAEKAIPYCNIVCITGEEMKDQLSGYLQVLYDANPESIGGEMPADDFYYIS